MPQRSLASLVLAPVLIGVLFLALACVAGERTDKLGDTLRVADTLHVTNDDSLAATQVASAVDTAPRLAAGDSLRQQGTAQRPDSAHATTSPTTTPVRIVEQSNGTSVHRHARRVLSALADSLSNFLVVVPADRAWFTAASRGKHMLVDVGRIDTKLGSDSATRAAYNEAMAHLSPLPVGVVLRLRGPWGHDDVRVRSFDVWNGRIVARVEGSRLVDSLARATDMLPATATRYDSAAARADSLRADSVARATPAPVKIDSAHAVAMACVHDTLPTELATRAAAVRDSLVHFLSDSIRPPYERMVAQSRVMSWWTPGCFGVAKALVVANRRTPDMEFAVERAVLVDSTGKVLPLRISDLRFKAHDALYVFDADGDGIDDLAAKGYGDRSGGVSILRLDPVARRFTRLSSGFAWEQ